MYYHDFSIGFNFWEVLLPLGMIFMIIPAYKRYRISLLREPHVEEVHSQKQITIFAVIFAVVFGILFMFESTAGVIQALDNSLAPTDSSAWSIILCPIAILFVVVMALGMFYVSGILWSWAVLGKLTEDTFDSEKMIRLGQERKERVAKHAAKRRNHKNNPSH